MKEKRIDMSLFFIFLSLFIFETFSRNYGDLYQKSVRSSLTLKREKKRLEEYILSDQDRATYLGTVKITTDFADQLPLRMYYQGSIVPYEHGIFHFPASKHLLFMHIVITQIKAPTQTTIDHLDVPTGTPYILYTLEKEESYSNSQKETWGLSKIDGNDGLSLPQNTLIIFLNPSYIEKLETSIWDKESSFIPLPTLILKKNTQLEDAATKQILAALDIDPFHKKPDRSVTMDYKNSIISRNE